ncbi:hypothetical protein PHSC3_000119 [Chlamydiales bacterium STE3]|nr:hypothetical protein PHSC3_000119 [Chlamydiales bacterium STE3]
MSSCINLFSSCFPKPSKPAPSLPRSIQGLSDDVTLRIFSFLPPRDISNAQQVCRKWQKISDSDQLWSKLYQTYYPKAMTINKKGFKMIFKLRHLGEAQLKQAENYLTQLKQKNKIEE